MRTPDMVLGAAALAFLTAVLAHGYRGFWRQSRLRDRTPTGFGAFLAPATLAAAWFAQASFPMLASLAVAVLATSIYWFDDSIELSARLRVMLSFASGAAIGGLFVAGSVQSAEIAIALVLLAGAFTVAMTNTVNFMDGADLNLATFVALTATLLLIYGWDSDEWASIAVACLAFIVPFAIVNARPKALYFGDSGSFAFAALFTIMGMAFLVGPHQPPPEAAIPAALPIVDTAVVTAHRIRIGHRFTVRHYFHLYQRLQRCRPGFAYLVPQPVSVGLSLVLVGAFERAGIDRILAVFLAMVLASPAVFLLSRIWWVRGEPGPPLARGETT